MIWKLCELVEEPSHRIFHVTDVRWGSPISELRVESRDIYLGILQCQKLLLLLLLLLGVAVVLRLSVNHPKTRAVLWS